jgi:hypothetical protein
MAGAALTVCPKAPQPSLGLVEIRHEFGRPEASRQFRHVYATPSAASANMCYLFPFTQQQRVMEKSQKLFLSILEPESQLNYSPGIPKGKLPC